ncbi:hypothetical protein JW707_03965 [Candidatus Woesearchaeota archaeon]|nr:hypothetical protein [Candidatus Woesearchaeota archaeon]
MTNTEDNKQGNTQPGGNDGAPSSPQPSAESQQPAETLPVSQPSEPKKKRARKKKAPSDGSIGGGKPGNIFQSGLEDITRALAAEHREVDRAVSNYENHLKALAVVREYLDSGIRKYRKGDTPVAGADNFTDGTSYVPVLKKIAGINRDLDEANKKYESSQKAREKERQAAKKKLDEAKAELDALKKEYGLQRERYESELEQARKKSEMYDFVKKRRDELIRKHPFTEVKNASQSDEAMAAARPTTYYGGQPTVATDCLEDAVKYQRGVDRIVDQLSQTTQKIKAIMDSFGKPPAK